jgi:predicted DNA-binding transcriptional regulator YafY
MMAEIFKDEAPTVGAFLDQVSGWSIPDDETDPLMLLPPSLRGPVKRRELVIIDYVDASGNRTTRKILLKEVATQHDYIYLVAYCYTRRAERTFRLDRIVRWEPAT